MDRKRKWFPLFTPSALPWHSSIRKCWILEARGSLYFLPPHSFGTSLSLWHPKVYKSRGRGSLYPLPPHSPGILAPQSVSGTPYSLFPHSIDLLTPKSVAFGFGLFTPSALP